MVDATDPKEVKISRGILRELIRLARQCQIACDGDDIPAFVKAFGAGDAELVDFLEDMSGLKQAAEDLVFLHDYLYHDGKLKYRLSRVHRTEAMTLCDGYDQMTEVEWDWSHVRDSTPDALAKARAYIEGVLPIR